MLKNFNDAHKEPKAGRPEYGYTAQLSYCIQIVDPKNAVNEAVEKYNKNIDDVITACEGVHQCGIYLYGNDGWSDKVYSPYYSIFMREPEMLACKQALEKINMANRDIFFTPRDFNITLANGETSTGRTNLYTYYLTYKDGHELSCFNWQTYNLVMIESLKNERHKMIDLLVQDVQPIHDLAWYIDIVEKWIEEILFKRLR